MARCSSCQSEGRLVCNCGPAYPEMGATVAKYRRTAAAAGSVAAMSKADRHAYGAAVEREIHAKNNAWWRAGAFVHVPVDRNVGATIRAQHAASLAAWPAKARAMRSIAAIESAYEAAMADKRKRAEAPVIVHTAPVPVAPIKTYSVPYVRSTPSPATTDRGAAARKAWATRRARVA